MKGLQFFLQIFEFVLFALNASTVVNMLKLSLYDKDLVFEWKNFCLLFLELLFFGFEDLVFLLIGVNSVFFWFFFSRHDFIHLFGQFVNLGFELDVLLNHFLPVRIGKVWGEFLFELFLSFLCSETWVVLVLVELRIFDGGVLLAHLYKIFIIVLLSILFWMRLGFNLLSWLGLHLGLIGFDFFVCVLKVLFVVLVLKVGFRVFWH